MVGAKIRPRALTFRSRRDRIRTGTIPRNTLITQHRKRSEIMIKTTKDFGSMEHLLWGSIGRNENDVDVVIMATSVFQGFWTTVGYDYNLVLSFLFGDIYGSDIEDLDVRIENSNERLKTAGLWLNGVPAWNNHLIKRRPSKKFVDYGTESFWKYHYGS